MPSARYAKELTKPSITGGWGPLHNARFRHLWIAALASNAGSWMHVVAAAWLMTTLTTSPVMASLVQTASTLPSFLLALPAGALADSVDRRRLLLWTQSWMLAAAAILGITTLAGATGPWTLLGLTFALGLGTAVNAPAWGASIPDLVPPEQLASAVTLNSVQFNAARALGPAVAGIVLASSGPAAAFLLNAVSFVGVLVAIFAWKATPRQTLALSTLGPSIREGLGFVGRDRQLRMILLRAGGFVLFGSALWALLPVLARQRLHASEARFGLMLSALGAGAATSGLWLSRNRSQWRSGTLLAGGVAVFALVNFGLSRLTRIGPAYLWLVAGGLAWVAVMSSLNVAAQRALPDWVRARGLSVYLLVFQGGMALSSWVWGVVASALGISTAMLLASAGLTVIACLIYFHPDDQNFG